MLEIVRATSEERLAQVRVLLGEYLEFIASHWPEVDRAAFAEEARTLPETHRVVLLGLVDGDAAACALLRDSEEPGACEARRLYVRPAFRRRGVARAMMLRLMSDAAGTGCRKMQLVTVKFFSGAEELYASLGFERVEPFRPGAMSPDVLTFMSRELDAPPAQ